MTTDQDSKQQRSRLSASERQTVRSIAEALGETAYSPCKQIIRIVRQHGESFAREALAETQKVEAGGGLRIENGERRRTPGGVFFYLVRGRLNYAQRREIFSQLNAAQRRRIKEHYKSRPPFDWEQRCELVAQLAKKRGEITEMQVRLIGRPRRYEKKREVVVLVMAHEANNPILPRGLPPFPTEPTLYTVYVSSGQWRKVEGSIKDGDRELVIEGASAYDAETQTVSVYTTAISTRKVRDKSAPANGAGAGGTGGDQAESESVAEAEAAATPAAKAGTEAKGEASGGSKAKAKSAKGKATKDKDTATKKAGKADSSAAPVELPPIPDDLPAEKREKLAGLYRAAQQYRERLAEIRAQPEDQQFGLATTERLLAGVEKQIGELLKPGDGESGSGSSH